MKIGSLLFKSKWQDKDAAVRRSAVATDPDPELLAALPEILRSDTDAGVRLAALKRVNDYELWRERSTADTDLDLRRTARTNYLALLCADAPAPPLSRRIAELETLSADEIVRVATSASLRELRALALARVDKPNVLADRVANDPDPQLRLQTLERISDPALLERIAERTRRTDKTVSRRARERVETMRIAGGDAGTIAQRARVLCDRLEALMRSPGATPEVELNAIDAEWRNLGSTVPAQIVSRYSGAKTIVSRPRESAVAEPPSPAPALAAAPPAESLAAQKRFVAALGTAAAEAQREREVRHAQLRELENLVPAYTAAIDAGDSSAAHREHALIEKLVASIGTVPAAIERRLAPLHARYAELDRWLHWSTHRRRIAICDEIAALPTLGLHPDALATRVRAARDEWQRLDTAEARRPESRGLDRRFHAVCHRALKPTKSYFDKRDELRHSHTQTLHALLTRAEGITTDSTDWKLIANVRSELGAALRQLDGVDPRERTVLAKRLKQHIAALAPRLAARDEQVKTAKMALIARAKALAEAAPQRDLPRTMRELQREWTATGNGRRAVDQRLWREFRAACDAAFGKLDTERKQRDAATASSRAQTLEVIEQIEALSSNDDRESSDATRQHLREIDARWQELAGADRGLEQRYRRARDAISMQLKDSARRTRLSRYTLALQKYHLLRALETGAETVEGVVPRWDAVGTVAAELAAPLDARYASAQAASSSADAPDPESALDVLVRLEFLAGLESPAADRQRRMDYQVQRLSARMRGGETTDPSTDLMALMSAWFALPAAPVELDARFDTAVRAAIDNLP